MAKTNLMKSKWCWVATQIAGGWRLKLSIGEKKANDINLSGLVLATEQEVKKIVKGGIVFVHKRTTITKRKIINK
jgi:hypothetical protein